MVHTGDQHHRVDGAIVTLAEGPFTLPAGTSAGLQDDSALLTSVMAVIVVAVLAKEFLRCNFRKRLRSSASASAISTPWRRSTLRKHTHTRTHNGHLSESRKRNGIVKQSSVITLGAWRGERLQKQAAQVSAVTACVVGSQ